MTKYDHTQVEGQVGALYFERPTPLTVAKELSAAYDADAAVRFWYGDERKPDWIDESDMMGYVGRSTGQHKIPLIIGVTHYNRNVGGASILTDCITRMMRRSKDGMWRDVYRAPFYKQPNYKIEENAFGGADVLADLSHYATFDDFEGAEQWVEFMTGKGFPARFMYQDNEDWLNSEEW